MRVAVPTEIKNNEKRVALTPAGVDTLIRSGHEVIIQAGAGEGSGLSDDLYRAAGATIVTTSAETWERAELLVKVKEPIASEYRHLRDDLTLFAFLHLAADPDLVKALMSAGTTAVAFETVQTAEGALPLLAPMSEVAGRLSIIAGANALLRSAGGCGVLMGGVPGTPPARVVVIGGGVAGEHAAANAIGLGADVTVIDLSVPRLRQIQARFGSRVTTRMSTPYEIAEQVTGADLVIGSVLVPGAAAPKLVTDDMVKSMALGSVLVDIAIDQGGCFEGSRPTTHDDPTFAVHGSIYYCVANMPGAVPHTSTRALCNATLPYVQAIANLGWDAAAMDPSLARGLNVRAGAVVSEAVAMAMAVGPE